MALVSYLSSVLSLACSPRPSRWVDKDTPQRHHCKVVDGEELQLVFSDEFQTAPAGPTGIDLDKWSPTEAIDTDTYGDTYLSPRLVSVANGSLNLSAADQGHASAGYTGAQVTSWNKFCYTGGYLEVRYKMPGRPREGLGIWPALSPDALDLLDGITTKYMLPLGGLGIAIAAGWLVSKTDREAGFLSLPQFGGTLARGWTFIIRFVTPVLVAAVILITVSYTHLTLPTKA